MFPHKKVALGVLCFVQVILAQKPIQGVVQDAETGAPIIGVNILLVGTKIGTVTDVEGLFTLEKPADIEPILRLSHTAYNNMELLIDSSYIGTGQTYDDDMDLPARYTYVSSVSNFPVSDDITVIALKFQTP
jgi:hypothetical protein